MRYVIIDRDKTVELGLPMNGRKVNRHMNTAVVDERELTMLHGITGTAEERAAKLGAALLSTTEIKILFSKGGWTNE